jgi:hypothetical protein
MTGNRNRDIEDALQALAERVGASVEFERLPRGRHTRARFYFNGQSRFNVLSNTPSDWNARHAVIGEAKRTLRRLGAAV